MSVQEALFHTRDACYTAGTEEPLACRSSGGVERLRKKEEAFVVAVMKEHVVPFSTAPLMFNHVRTSPFSHGEKREGNKTGKKKKKKKNRLLVGPTLNHLHFQPTNSSLQFFPERPRSP